MASTGSPTATRHPAVPSRPAIRPGDPPGKTGRIHPNGMTGRSTSQTDSRSFDLHDARACYARRAIAVIVQIGRRRLTRRDARLVIDRRSGRPVRSNQRNARK